MVIYASSRRIQVIGSNPLRSQALAVISESCHLAFSEKQQSKILLSSEKSLDSLEVAGNRLHPALGQKDSNGTASSAEAQTMGAPGYVQDHAVGEASIRYIRRRKSQFGCEKPRAVRLRWHRWAVMRFCNRCRARARRCWPSKS